MVDAPTISTLLTLIGFGGFITLAGFVWKLADRLRGLEAEAATAKERAETAEKEARTALSELAQFKVEAAQRFVTDAMLGKLEDRIVDAIKGIGGRLDWVIDKLAREAPQPNRGA